MSSPAGQDQNGRPGRRIRPELSSGSDPGLPRVPSSSPAADAPGIEETFHIGLVTSSGALGEDELLAVRQMESLYGLAGQGGRIRHAVFPENYLEDLETAVSRITDLAADPLMRVIIVNEAVPGTAEAFRLIRSKRPEIFLLAAESHEDFQLISETADLAVSSDFMARAYLIPRTVQKLGAETFVHISFPRHMISEAGSRKRAAMEEACQELGLKFVYENSPDPLAAEGLQGARDFISENVPKWLEKYGPKTAFYTTSPAQTAPLISRIVELGGYFAEADDSSPLLGYPEALAQDVGSLGGDWTAVLDRLEKTAVRLGAGGRLGTWTASMSFSHTAGLVEFGRMLAAGQVQKDDYQALIRCYEKFSPGVKWSGGSYFDREGQTLDNVFLLFQDTYIFGEGYQGNTELDLPPQYQPKKNRLSSGAAPGYYIGVVTGTQEQGGEDLLGALEMVRRYGQAGQGGLIRHLVYTDDYLDNPPKAADLISSLADDPLMKVVVVNQALDGTAEAFRRIKAKRPDIFCLAAEPFEESEVIAGAADLVIVTDYVARGYLIPQAAQILGARTFVHLSFPRHMAMESIRVRNVIMKEACKDLGLEYVEVSTLDPIGPQGLDKAAGNLTEVFDDLLSRYGKETAFFCTNDALTEHLIKAVTEKGGIFVEADIPSPLLGYPQALEVDVEPIIGQWGQVLKKVEDEVAKRGGAGRLGTWAYPLGFSETAGLVEFGKLLAEQKAQVTETSALLKCLDKLSPGARWNGSYYNDPQSGKPWRNLFLVYQDTYVFGRGYIETTKVDVPLKYFSLH
jgi:DNA-binding LacI/PurR family transcriptional regulator